MKKLNDLFDLVKQSDVTLIGYTFQNERIKDKIKVIKNRFGMDGDEILYNTQQQIVEF